VADEIAIELSDREKTAGNVITPRRRLFSQRGYRRNGRRDYENTPLLVVSTIGLLYPALSVVLGLKNWYAINDIPY